MMQARLCLLIVFPLTAVVPVRGTVSSSGSAPTPAPAPASTPAPSNTSFTTTGQAFVPWKQHVDNSSPWDRPDVGLLEVDPRQRWVMFLDENPFSHHFVPPSPPALAEPVPPRARPLSPKVPEGLLDFAAETFYMPYGQMLDSRLLSDERTDRINRYRSERDHLVTELRTLLDRTKNLPEPRRTETLRDFSSAHTHRASALEAEAEAIRADLTSPGFFRFGASAFDLARSADWSRDAARPGSFAYILPLLGAQFYAGFSADQRLLLHEMTMEQRARAHPPVAAKDASPTDHIFFLPSTSRIRFPADLPATLSEKIQRFTAQKTLLKSELQSALDSHQFKFAGSRAEHLAQLAREQAPAFAELHRLAEEIRQEFARIPYPDAPSGPTLSSELTERVGHATTRKAALQRELIARLKQLQTELPGEHIKIVRRGHGLALSVDGPPSPQVSSQKRERVLSDIELFNASIAGRYTDLSQEMDALRRDLRAIAPAGAQSSARDIDRLAAEFDRSYRKQEAWDRYRDYHAAVLIPGLSPELRRLLYRAAWSDLTKQQVLAFR